VLDMLSEAGLLGCRTADAPMKVNVKLLSDQERLNDPDRCRKLVGKLNYLTIIRLDMTFTVSVVIQFRSVSKITHWDVVVQILIYLKKALRKRLLFSDYGRPRVVGFSDVD